MTCYKPGCLGNYDFDNIATFARKRFIEGYNTIELMETAKSNQEKEEIALVAMLDLSDQTIRDMKLDCKHAGVCKVTDCRDVLKKMIEAGITENNKNIN